MGLQNHSVNHSSDSSGNIACSLFSTQIQLTIVYSSGTEKWVILNNSVTIKFFLDGCRMNEIYK